MGLMRLLTVGHTLVGVKDAPSPYRVTKQGWFPRFGFSKASNTTDAQAENQIVTTATMAAVAPERPVSPKLDVPPAPPIPRGRDRKPLYARVLAFRQNPRRPALLRQGELSLDTVRVVRNDLSDADVEILRSRAKRVGAEAPAVKKAAAAPVQAVEFESLANRMLKAEWLLL